MNKSFKGNTIKDLSKCGNDGKLFLYDGKVKKENIKELVQTLIPDRRYELWNVYHMKDEGIVDGTFQGDIRCNSEKRIDI